MLDIAFKKDEMLQQLLECSGESEALAKALDDTLFEPAEHSKSDM